MMISAQYFLLRLKHFTSFHRHLGAITPSFSRNGCSSLVQNSQAKASYCSDSSTIVRNELVETFLNLEKLDTNLFRSTHLLPGVPTSQVVYGGQVIGQSLIAATSTVSKHVEPHSLHCYFIKPGNIKIPILYYVDILRDGGSFCTRSVKAVQEGQTIFSSMVSFHKDEPDSVLHQDRFPSVPQPDSLREAHEIMTEMLQNLDLDSAKRAKLQERLDGANTFDIKPTHPELFLRMTDESLTSESHIYAWVRCKGVIGDSPRLHQCVAAYISDFTMAPTALASHMGSGFRVGMICSLDHTMWFHSARDFVIDDWMLYETWSPKAAGARAFTLGRLWSRDGRLVISTAQEALIRAKIKKSAS